MNSELIEKTEKFLIDTFQESPYLKEHPNELAYRLEHSYRVANIGKEIAIAEGFDVEHMIIACLLHDISYCQEMSSKEDRKAHGRRSAQIAKPFLDKLGLSKEQAYDILFGIAIHVDDYADFEWKRTPFAETVSDADNIDRFDVYRIYETLEYNKFSGISLDEKKERVKSTLEQLHKLYDLKLSTQTATKLWEEKLYYYISFYEKLQKQLDSSTSIL